MTTHDHPPKFGPPYDASLPIVCPACIDMLWEARYDLCEKYGWESWPDKLNQGRSELPPPSSHILRRW